jgi:hypothetical protein
MDTGVSMSIFRGRKSIRANKNLYLKLEPDVTLKLKNHQRTQGEY